MAWLSKVSGSNCLCQIQLAHSQSHIHVPLTVNVSIPTIYGRSFIFLPYPLVCSYSKYPKYDTISEEGKSETHITLSTVLF